MCVYIGMDKKRLAWANDRLMVEATCLPRMVTCDFVRLFAGEPIRGADKPKMADKLKSSNTKFRPKNLSRDKNENSFHFTVYVVTILEKY